MLLSLNPSTIATCVVLLLIVVCRITTRRQRTSEEVLKNIPEVKFENNDTTERYITDTRSLMALGYEKYSRNGLPYRIRHILNELGQVVILPMKYMVEVKGAPESALSFPAFSEKAWLLSHINAPQQTHAAAQVVKLNLNRNLDNLLPNLENEISSAVEDCLPNKEGWHTVTAYPWICQIVARVTALALVGPELCRNPEWLELSIGTTVEVFKATYAVRDNYSPSWRWTAKWWSEQPKKLMAMRRKAANLLSPFYRERLDESENGESSFNDTLKWLLREPGAEKSIAGMADQQLFLTIASVHTTTATLTSILFDLMAHPKYRGEILTEMEQTLDSRGQKAWTFQGLGQMQKLDSFMKESQRVHPLGWIAGQRLALKPYTFKDGLEIPRGTIIMFPADGVHHDPDNYPDPNTFDAYRFQRLRDTIDPNRFHFASVSDTSMFFGAGSHACPGRFFTAVIIKLALLHLMTKYDVEFIGADQSRPVDMHNFMATTPNAMAEIRLKRKA